MRDPHAPAWTKFTVFAAAVLRGRRSNVEGRSAGQFDRLFVFGDSHADLTLSDSPARIRLRHLTEVESVARLPCSHLQKNSIPGIITDVAVGGATADPKLGNPFPNSPWDSAATEPARAGSGISQHQSLVWFAQFATINIGGNDIRDILTNTPAQNLALGYPASITS